MKDEYKRLSREWGSKARKEEARSRKKRLREAVRKEPTEPEVHPDEILLTEFEANCQHSVSARVFGSNDRFRCIVCWRPM